MKLNTFRVLLNSVRQFLPAVARTLHKNRKVRRTHPQAIFCARTPTKHFFIEIFNFQKISSFLGSVIWFTFYSSLEMEWVLIKKNFRSFSFVIQFLLPTIPYFKDDFKIIAWIRLGIIWSQGMKLFWLRYLAWSKIFNCSIFLRKNSEKKFPFFVGIKSSRNDSIGSRSQFESFCSFKSFSKQSHISSWLILVQKISVKFGVW